MTFEKVVKDDMLLFRIDGAIDTEGGNALSECFREIGDDPKIARAEFDLREVPSITSAGIGKLLRFFEHFDKNGGSMVIRGISESLREQFEEIHLNRIIPIL